MQPQTVIVPPCHNVNLWTLHQAAIRLNLVISWSVQLRAVVIAPAKEQRA